MAQLQVDFESGTYSTGNLGGQDSWTNDGGDASDTQVQNSVAYLGSQSVRAQNTGLHRIYKTFTSTAADSQFMFMRMDSLGTSGDGAGYWFRNGTTTIGRIGFGTSHIEVFNGSSWTSILDNYSTSTWYEIEFWWDGGAGSNGEIKARAREAGGTWGSYSTQGAGENNFTVIDRAAIRTIASNGDMYFDDLSDSEESAAASTSIKSIAGVAQADIKSIAGVIID